MRENVSARGSAGRYPGVSGAVSTSLAPGTRVHTNSLALESWHKGPAVVDLPICGNFQSVGFAITQILGRDRKDEVAGRRRVFQRRFARLVRCSDGRSDCNKRPTSIDRLLTAPFDSRLHTTTNLRLFTLGLPTAARITGTPPGPETRQYSRATPASFSAPGVRRALDTAAQCPGVHWAYLVHPRARHHSNPV